MPSVATTMPRTASFPPVSKRVPHPHLIDTTYPPTVTVYPKHTEYSVTLPLGAFFGLRQLLSSLNPFSHLAYAKSTAAFTWIRYARPRALHMQRPPPQPVPSHLVAPTPTFNTPEPTVEQQIDRSRTQVFRVRDRKTFLIIFYDTEGLIKGQSVFEVEDPELDVESGGEFREERYWGWGGRRWRVVLRFEKRSAESRSEGTDVIHRGVGGKVEFMLVHSCRPVGDLEGVGDL